MTAPREGKLEIHPFSALFARDGMSFEEGAACACGAIDSRTVTLNLLPVPQR